jgi:outer membrane protein insertion porin family
LTDLFFKGGETIRGFDRAGYGPRDACANPVNQHKISNCRRDPLGGQIYWASTAELRFPFPYIPDSIGMQGAVFVDAGSLFDPSGSATSAVNQEGSYILDDQGIRLSTGFSIIWQSPLGPLRADIAEALLKAQFDKTQIFRFGASTNF